ncbi:MAG: M3 family oligoendopeptidase, partial [Erysipelotrichales bacterium]
MKRSEQVISDTWDLEMMYDENNVDRDIENCFKMVEEIKKYKDIEFNKDVIIEALDLYFKLLIEVENIYVYYSHTQDTDFNNDKVISKFNTIKQEYNKMMVELSFLIPQISQCDNELLNSILDDKDLVEYHKTIRNILNNKTRYLSVEQEKIISTYNLNDSAAYQLFSAFTNSDMRFKDAVDTQDKSYEMSEGKYGNYIRSKDRILRKSAFESILGEYSKFNQTLATNYISELKDSLISMKNRSYNSTLQQALEPNQIPEYVYTNLLNSVEDNIEINHQYLELRKKELKLDDLSLYDVYVSMVEDVDKKYPFEEGKDMVEQALAVFPKEYTKVLNDALNKRWIDKYENEGKRSGAYSGGSYKSVPYMLLNYHDDINDVFTLAHELGHSMHSYFANESNPYQNANYKIFIAEVASTVNELLLINHLLENETSSKIKKYLYNYLLEQFRTTMIRQTMFAR